jgi:hypothetical protein
MLDATVAVFWWVAEQLRLLAHVVLPFLVLGASVMWSFRERSSLGVVALLGGLLFAASELTRYVVPSVRGVVFNNMPPATEQNALTFFLYIHAWWIGLALFSLAVFIHFARRRTNAS